MVGASQWNNGGLAQTACFSQPLTCCQPRRLAHGQPGRELGRQVRASVTSGEEHALPGLHATERWRGLTTETRSALVGPCAAGGTVQGQAPARFRICVGVEWCVVAWRGVAWGKWAHSGHGRKVKRNVRERQGGTSTGTQHVYVEGVRREKEADTHWLDWVLPGLNARTGRLGPSSRADTRAPSRTVNEESTWARSRGGERARRGDTAPASLKWSRRR